MSSHDLFAPSPETLRQSVNLTPKDLEAIGMDPTQIEGFLTLRKRFLQKPLADWEKVDVVPDEFLVQYDQLSGIDRAIVVENLNKLVVVQLNGGLGTMMGMKGPKSGLQILKKATDRPVTILDCKIQQIEELNKEFGVDIPLVFLNSMHTDEDTKKILEKFNVGKKLSVYTCLQSQYPMMFKDTLAPVPSSTHDKQCFYPPGSGEVFSVLLRSGLLKKFKDQGKEFIFISNVENLGATVDLKIFQHFARSTNLDFFLEVTNRISTDTHGGIPIRYKKDERVHILELSQVPYDFSKKFSLSNYKYWNTNNIWCRITPVMNMLNMNALTIDFIVKNRLFQERHVVQLETPAAMAIHSFRRSAGIFVPRIRYFPILTTAHLLMAQSDLFELNNQGLFTMNSRRVPATAPLIKLGSSFQTLADYEKRFGAVPNMLELDHLTVSGEVTFGANVTLKGTVIIVAEPGSQIDIPTGSILENKVVSGTLILREN